MDPDGTGGSAACVVEHKECEGKDTYLLKEDRLGRLLLKADCRDKPVAVVSIAGGARRGKSFLLSLFLRYLRAKANWLEREDTPIGGFAWKMSSKRVTTGIHIWDELFTVRLADGKDACILLMDTEGTFDCEESLAHSVTVFALSTLLSSVQIYNLKDNIHMDDLLHLQTSGKQRDDVKKVKEDIKYCFRKLDCFLMPYPGEKVAGDPDFNGSLSDVNEDFKVQLQHLVPRLLSPENLVVKTIAGKPITCKELLEYFKTYVGVYNNRAEIPEPKSIFEVTTKTRLVPARYLSSTRQAPFKTTLRELLERYKIHRDSREERTRSELMEAANRVLRKYAEDMVDVMRTVPLLTRKDLQEKHKEKKKMTIQNFMEKKGIANEDVESQSAIYFTDRQWRENTADLELRSIVQSVVLVYGTHMGRSCDGAVLTEEELENEHEKYHKEAIDAFSHGTKNTPCPYLLDEQRNNLTISLDGQYKNYIELRESKERKAKVELMNATEEAMEKYSQHMSKLLIDLISEEDLNGTHEIYLREAMESLGETGKKYPHLVKEYKEDLSQRMRSQHERYKTFRSSQEQNAVVTLQDALARSLQNYELEMSCLCGGRDGSHLLTEKDLTVGHKKFRKEALETFWTTGVQWPHHAETYKDQLEECVIIIIIGRGASSVAGPHGSSRISRGLLRPTEGSVIFGAFMVAEDKMDPPKVLIRLTEARDKLERRRKWKETRTRKLLEKAVRETAREYIGPSRMKTFHGETVVDRKELAESHSQHKDAVVRSFRAKGDWAAAWLVEEYREILETTLDSWHGALERKMEEERAKAKDVEHIVNVGSALNTAVGSMLGPVGAFVAGTTTRAVTGLVAHFAGKSRWQNSVVLPDPDGIRMPPVDEVVLSSDEEE
ncbi:unnamed protein product [Darwinula stevensoni]|uniref:GB1/RHD3-type G domain-containing protein n=1 Tax=Darwinula stevensoni TaxID=69355 RepID=A0A7R9A4V3_9CRUS|nr:unnamed protein product [Darwinula stevensoni]CAG0884147.1 unnamed protein product [Darwinula stevensoni]